MKNIDNINKLEKNRKGKMHGIVVSDKMDKTIVVKVEKIKQHPLYLRRYKVHKKYKAHDEKNEYKEGDKVIIEESRPLSKDKRWVAIKKSKIKKDPTGSFRQQKSK